MKSMGNQSVVICGNDEYMVSTLARQWVDNICPLDRQTTDLEVYEGRVGTVDEAVHVLCLLYTSPSPRDNR